MIEVTDERFEELVDLALDKIPEEFLRPLRNVVLLIDHYNPESRGILGLYEGVALTERTHHHTGFLPDTITFYKGALQDFCSSEEELIEQVRITVMHEIGHFFGLGEEDLDRLGYA